MYGIVLSKPYDRTYFSDRLLVVQDWNPEEGATSGLADGGYVPGTHFQHLIVTFPYDFLGFDDKMMKWPGFSRTPPSSPSRRWNDPANYAPAAVAVSPLVIHQLLWCVGLRDCWC
jgi:hypothetical protein